MNKIENISLMLERLREAGDDYPLLPGLVYRSPYDFVLAHGRSYPVTPWKETYSIGLQRMCFANSLAFGAIKGLNYIEGFALAPTGEIILHAWNATQDGELVDATWANTGLAYCGVEFSLERADDAIWHGDACILNDENRNYPIFQKRWTGDNHMLEWAPSDRLDFWRAYNSYPMEVLRENLPESAKEWLKSNI